jgi:hypothetical protein
MDRRKLKSFSRFIGEEFPPPMAVAPSNIAGGGNIAGLPPDLPPVPTAAQRKKSKILKRKLPKT